MLCLLFTGCIYPADRGRALEVRVDKVTSDNEEMGRRLHEIDDRLAASLPKIDEKLSQVGQAMEGLDKISRRNGADTGVQLQKNIEDLAKLRGQMEIYAFKLNDMEASLKKKSDEVTPSKPSESKKKVEEVARPSDKKEFLALADKKAKEGDVAVARQLYNEYIKKWPQDPSTAEAHFGLGQSFYEEDKCREALFEFGKVIQEHPKSSLAPDAYLHSSECFKKLKMRDEAKLALEELIKSYPKSEAAKTAKAQLISLSRDKHKKG